MNLPLKLRCEEQLIFLSSLLNEINTEEYNAKLEVLNNTSIGEHVRHCIEFFLCLFEGLQNDNVCYDLRKRNKKIEDDKAVALAFFKVINIELNALNTDKILLIQYPQTLGEQSDPIKSTLYRELLYCMDHVTHHSAIIKLAVKASFSNVEINDDFGLAPSTLYNQNK